MLLTPEEPNRAELTFKISALYSYVIVYLVFNHYELVRALTREALALEILD